MRRSLRSAGYSKYEVDPSGKIYGSRGQKRTRPDKDGYEQVVVFSDEGKRHTEFVHKLVAIAFVANPLHKDRIRHVDRDRKNNCANNLQWW